MLLLIVGLILLIGLIFGPQWWVRSAMRRHADERADIPGTGAELAEHLLARANIENVGVEVTDDGDHYDPDGRCVRLLPSRFSTVSPADPIPPQSSSSSTAYHRKPWRR